MYSQPAGTAGVDGQIIYATPYNNLVSDIGNEITNSLPVNGSKGMSASLPMNGNRATLMADPLSPQDAATKNYVDTTAGPASVFIGGTTTGTANAQVLATVNPASFTKTAGFRVVFTPGFTNTGATTLAITTPAIAATNVMKLGGGGAVALGGGELVAGQPTEAICDGTNFILLANPVTETGPLTSLASAATTDLGTIGSRNINITGTTTITSFGSTASTAYPLYYLTFAASLTLTYNATSLILPAASNIITTASDSALMMYLGSGNWRMIAYYAATGAPLRITSIPMRQTVIAGPVDGNDRPNFLPATSGGNSITGQNFNTTSMLVTAANGFNSSGAADLTVSVSSNPTWSGFILAAPISSITFSTTTATVTTSSAHNLLANMIVTVSGATPATYNGTYVITPTSSTTFTYVMATTPSGNATVVGSYLVTNFIGFTVSGTVATPFSSTLPWNAQRGGSINFANNVFTFDIGLMLGYLGNGTSAPVTPAVMVGEVQCNTTGVAATYCYAYQGYYDSGWINTLPALGTNVINNANIGVADCRCECQARCIVAEGHYNVGDVVTNLYLSYASSFNAPLPVGYTRTTVWITTGAAVSISAVDKSTGASGFAFTLANWAYRLIARRNW